MRHGKAERIAAVMVLLVSAPLWVLAYYLEEEELSAAAAGLRFLAGLIYLAAAVLMVAALLRQIGFRRG